MHFTQVIGKSRVTPTKVVTLPRLELSAVTFAAAISNMLRERSLT